MPDPVLYLHQFPGYLFVLATLLPLASFLLLLLACAGWGAVRPYREMPWGEPLYQFLGGDRGGRGAALLATAAIFLAFLCSLTGFLTFLLDDHAVHKAHAEVPLLREDLAAKHKEIDDLDERVKTLSGKKERDEEQAKRADLVKERDAVARVLNAQEALLARMHTAYTGRMDWIRLGPAGPADTEHGPLLQLGFRIDHLSGLMFVMVTFVALLIHLFSMGYMEWEQAETVHDPLIHANTLDGTFHRRGRYGRFFLFLSLFCFSMLNLVLADNLFQVFVSWELVGICSYLLIGFYYERTSAANAANKAFITNRVGDAGFLIGLLILWTGVGTFNFEDLFARLRSPRQDSVGTLAPADQFMRVHKDGTTLTLDPGGAEIALTPRNRDKDFRGLGGLTEEGKERISVSATGQPTSYSSMPYWLLVAAGLGVFLGCVGKSAQFPLQVWLPDAMEGPTPVSALIHAATMVAAGVYLVGRCYPLFAPEVLLLIAYTGAISLFLAATTALVMTDIKKVLAWSTVSQLGYMMLALGVGGWVAGLFHLLTHAFFKALLFLCSGSVIHGCHHEQHIGKLGGLGRKMPITALTMLIGVLAISGLPLFSGWYSKDAVLAAALGFVTEHRHHALLFVLPLVTVALTTFYMFRLWFLTFTGQPRDAQVHQVAQESSAVMTIPLVLLAICSIGVAWGWPLWDTETSWLTEQLHHAQPACVAADFAAVAAAAHAGHVLVLVLALGLVLIGLLFAAQLYYYRTMDPGQAAQQFPAVHALLVHKWYFDEVYRFLLVRPVLILGRRLQAFDLVVIDGLINGLARLVVNIARWDGLFDRYLIDGLVNRTGAVVSAIGGWLRRWETGSLRNYILFLVLAAVGIYLMLSSL
jgi:NADH-quinone oxidoreductase subunit L